jgi:hypothetical protein
MGSYLVDLKTRTGDCELETESSGDKLFLNIIDQMSALKALYNLVYIA